MRRVGRDHYDLSFVQLSGKRLSGTLEKLPHCSLAVPAVRQIVRQLQKQIQGSGFILPLGLTSGPPLKSSSRCLRETNEK